MAITITDGGKMPWADNLRAFATVSVIILHVSAAVLYQYGSISDFSWWTANVFDSAVRFCVPVFVMLTGALLLQKEYPLGVFLKKRLARIVLPFVFWSCIYMVYNFSQNDENMGIDETVKWFFLQIKNGSAYHLWYVYMIIGIYLFVPIIGKFVRNSTEKEILYFLLIWVVTLFVCNPVVSKFSPDFNLFYFSGYIGYLVLGYYLSVATFDKRIQTVLGLLFACALIFTIFGTGFLSYREGKFEGLFYNYLTPNVLLLSIGIFLFFKNHGIANAAFIKIRNIISKYSYGIYLVHVLVLMLAAKLGVDGTMTNPIIAIPATTLICLGISLSIIYSISKLPFGKYISG
ncbi:MAG TPA: acyltransferase family protein [Flavobacterium sp.]|nr:acyltransferase family protein [Flavobacterium sp.]